MTPSRSDRPPPAGDPAPPLDWAVDRGFGEEIAREAQLRVRARRRKQRAVAGALVATLAAGLWWTLPAPPRTVPETAPQAIKVLVPQRTTLPDGSTVDAQAEAVLKADFQPAQRHVELSAGEAFFAVARDPARPFVVRAGFVSVRALGTAFTVRHSAEGVTVLVTEGQVAVEVDRPVDPSGDRPPPTVLGVGHRLSVEAADAAPTVDSPASAEIAQALAWRIPRLSFSGAPLAEVAAQFARHGGVEIAFGDPDLRTVQISGVLRANNREVLFRLLASDHGIRAEQRGSTFVLYRAP